LTDAGRGSRVEDALSRALKTSEKYIDLAIISHPQLDHYGGMRYVLDSYDLGAILTNGRAPDVVSPEWADMLAKIKEKGVPMIRVGKGDSIRFGEDKIKIISPDAALLRAKDQNESALVARAEVGGASVLLTGDIGKKTEAKLAAESPELDSHILKVAHHGSKYSVSASFFRSVSPILAIIEVGRNSYGHPSREALELFGERGVPVLRTDLSGNIYALLGAGELKVLTEKGGQ
jgi:competence protein ComEC